MPFQRVGDVIDRIRWFHRQLQRCYERTSERQPDERLTLLLEHMGRHERNLDACLEEFGHEDTRGIRESWLQYVPDKRVQQAIDDTSFGPDMDVEEVIRRALALDGVLIEFYRGLATSLTAPRVRELFAHLLEMEESKGKEHSRSVAELLARSGSGERTPPGGHAPKDEGRR